LNPFCRLDIFDRKMTVEGELVLRCRYAANEEEGSAAIRALFAVMQPAIQKFVRSKAESAEDAEDVIQRTFEKLSRAIFELDDPDKVKAWCFRVAGNHLRDLWRAKQHRGKSVPLFESAADPAMASYFRAKEPNPSEETECIDLWRIIEQAGNSEDVLLVRLYYLEGKTHAEIGDGLKIPKSTVRTRIANVLQKAKVIYERDARKLA
jgi:RNA polymerase sigma factor (sigma-70 family)